MRRRIYNCSRYHLQCSKTLHLSFSGLQTCTCKTFFWKDSKPKKNLNILIFIFSINLLHSGHFSSLCDPSIRFMPLNAASYLGEHGWQGKGVPLDGKEGRGLRKPLALPMKRNLKGLGKDRDRATEWWDCLFEVSKRTNSYYNRLKAEYLTLSLSRGLRPVRKASIYK